jgi:hypothetical protein
MKLKSRTKLNVSLVLVFLSGLLLGSGLSYVIIKNQQSKADPIRKFRADIFKIMVHDLKLTPEQQKKVSVLLDKGLKRMEKFRLKHAPEILMIIRENHDGMKEILTPEQWEIYEGYRRDKLDAIQRSIPPIK